MVLADDALEATDKSGEILALLVGHVVEEIAAAPCGEEIAAAAPGLIVRGSLSRRSGRLLWIEVLPGVGSTAESDSAAGRVLDLAILVDRELEDADESGEVIALTVGLVVVRYAAAPCGEARAAAAIGLLGRESQVLPDVGCPAESDSATGGVLDLTMLVGGVEVLVGEAEDPGPAVAVVCLRVGKTAVSISLIRLILRA